MLNLKKRGIGTHEPKRDFTGASLGGHYAQCGQGAGTGQIRRGRSSGKPSVGSYRACCRRPAVWAVPTEHAGILGNGL